MHRTGRISVLLSFLSLVFCCSLSLARPQTFITIPSEGSFQFDLVQGELQSSGAQEIALLGYTHWFTTPIPLRWGVTLLGAVDGTTSGFFGGGLALGTSFRPYRRFRVDLSGEVGGAGGGDVNVGGGLFIRPRATAGWQFDGFSVSAGASLLLFPSGFDSVHPTVELHFPSEWTITPTTEALPEGELVSRQVWRRDRWRLGVGIRRLHLEGQDRKSSGQFARHGQLLVMKADHLSGRTLFTSLEVAQGVSEIQDYRGVALGAGLRFEIVDDVQMAPQLKLGLGGGGDVPTGQGSYFDLGATLTAELVEGIAVSAEAGFMRSLNALASYPYLGGGLGVNFLGLKRKRLAPERMVETYSAGLRSRFDLGIGLTHWLSKGATGDDTSLFNLRLAYRPLPFVAVYGGLVSAAVGRSGGLVGTYIGLGPVIPVGPVDLSAIGAFGAAGGSPIAFEKGRFFSVAGEVGLTVGDNVGLWGGIGRHWFETVRYDFLRGGLRFSFGMPWSRGSQIQNIRKYDPARHDPGYRTRRKSETGPPPPPRPAASPSP